MSGWDPAGKVDVEEYLESLDIENVRKEGYHEFRFSCPFPAHDNGDQSASCYMNQETTAYHCHGCKKSGNAVSFASDLLTISPIKAKKLLREAYDPASFDPDARTMVDEVRAIFKKAEKSRETTENQIIDESVLLDFDIDWLSVSQSKKPPPQLAYMLNRGFSAETLSSWRFGYDERRRRISFPVYDHNINLVGLKGRAWDGRTPKYLMLGDDEESDDYGFGRFQSGHVVFGLHRANIYDEVIIVEGEFNCIILHQLGYENTVALNGSRLTDRQADLISRVAESATFFFDGDTAGDRGLWGYTDEKGEDHPGALDKLALNLDVALVDTTDVDGDAADYAQRGEIDLLDGVLERKESLMMARLRRRRSGLVESQSRR